MRDKTTSAVRTTTTALVLAALTVLCFPAAGSAAMTPLVELRVEGPDSTLEPGTWYATGSERIRKSKPNDACKRTSGRIAVSGPTPLSLVESGAKANPDLRQVRVRRDEAGLFVCEIGSVLGRPFTDPSGFAGWSYYEKYEFGSAAAADLALKAGDQILWVFSDFGAAQPANTGPTLELRQVPARSPGTFTARVVEHGFDGSTNPATGATIEGAEQVVELGSGNYEVTVAKGNSTLFASRGLDIRSNQVKTCVKPNPDRCPDAHGRKIVGSTGRDRIRGSAGWDRITSGRGRDRISLRDGGRDRVSCGGGRDTVVIDAGDDDDRIRRNCERVRER
jgi:hypothetical protein